MVVLLEHPGPDFLVVVHTLASFKGIDRELFSRALTGSLCAHVGSLIVGPQSLWPLSVPGIALTQLGIDLASSSEFRRPQYFQGSG